MVKPFSVCWRNPGHWDIMFRDARAFRIRGGTEPTASFNNPAGDVVVLDERPESERLGRETTVPFKSVDAAMAYICAELMTERLAAAPGKREGVHE